ncbi:MAG TPA: hypothetical protein VIY49_08215 [Bryobacteraceae bacterium]
MTRLSRRFVAAVCLLAMASFASAAGAQTSDSTTRPAEYYLDCSAPHASGDGRSPETAWNALHAVNEHIFLPGDTIRLRRGTECHGLLWPKGSGSTAAAIRLAAYGSGPRPKVTANKGDEEAFKLFGQEYWDVDSLEFSGGCVFGVYVSGDKGILHHIHLRNLSVHEVFGGDVKHKESGLVVVSPGTVHQHFDDVLVEGITANATDQWAGILVGGGNFGEVTEEDWNTHVVVRNSVVHDVYGDGIILFRVKDGVIDHSAAWQMGMQPTQSIGTPNAIWTWMCKDCVVSRNEAFLTDSPGVDGGAFDIDYGNIRNSVTENYGHDTQGYCIAVFGAGYVTHDSVVEGNLCIENGRSPRMARYQGAIFLWTWNDGVIENLRVEKNVIFWNPPGNFPALLNRGDIRGSERIFKENQIYSGASSLIESNKNLDFRNNRYITCGGGHAAWTFNDEIFNTFEAYRTKAKQEQGSSWTSYESYAACLPGPTEASATDNAHEGWRVVSEFPVHFDSQELLDAASLGQLLVLKNQQLQFRPSGLRSAVTLYVPQAVTSETLQNALLDLSQGGLQVSTRNAGNSPIQPRTRVLRPDGSVAAEWHGSVGPTELGLALRKVLGTPIYSQVDFTAR